MFLDIKTFPTRWSRIVRGLSYFDWLFSSFYMFLPNFFKTNSKNELHKTDFCFDHFLVFVLFFLIVFYSEGRFFDSLDFV